MDELTPNNLLSLRDLRATENLDTIGDLNGVHWHLDPVTEFYNKCHDEEGKFCETEGGVTGRSSLPDNDGTGAKTEVPVKRGKHGGSLVDPNEGTTTIDGVRGYDSETGKPVPGSDAWLEAHGISKEIFDSRPYVRFEADRDDPALQEAFKDYEKADKFWRQRAEQKGQKGGYIMYKHPVPGSPWGPVAPQVRPNKDVVTNAAKEAYAAKVLENDRERLAVLKKTTPGELLKERRAQVKKAEINLERVKNATPDKVRAEATKNLENAQLAVKKAKESGDQVKIFEAKKDLVAVKRQHDKDMKDARHWDAEKQLYDAEIQVTHAKNRLQRSIDNPKQALADEIKSQSRVLERSEKRLKDTAAKYVFSPGTSSARIDMNPDPQNIKNLNGKGRIYFAMEGSIKNDAILHSLKKEDPTATVVNVPSVTLWQQKAGLPGEAAGEIAWFTKKYGKGREIILIPDADGVTNPNVMMQAKAMSTALRSNGAGSVIVAAPPVKYGTKKVIDHFNLPSGVDEGRKGIDDHLGAGRGELGQLQYSKINNRLIPKYDLSEYTKAAGGDGPKINRSAVKNTEAALAAISGIAGPAGITKLPKKMLAQTSGLPLTSAKEARDRLVDLGIITVEHVFDEQALSRGRRIRNPKVTDERVNELIKMGVIKQPQLDKPFTEVSIDESPVVTIVNKKYVIPEEAVSTGILSDLPSWDRPKTYKGWTSAVTKKPDTSGIAARQREQAAKTLAKNAARAPKPLKKAPPGRRLVRTQAGARRYGVSIGQPIPELRASVDPVVGVFTSMVLIPDWVHTEADLVEFYNQCHDEEGKFCPTDGGEGVTGKGRITDALKKAVKAIGREAPNIIADVATEGVTGNASLTQWPPSKGRNVSVVESVKRGSVTVDGIKAKTVYEMAANNGKKVRLYDKTGKAGPYYKEILQNHARMSEMYPDQPVHNVIVTRSGKGMNPQDFTLVNSNHNETFINGDHLGFDLKNVRPDYFMTSARGGNTRNMDYLLTHEYGHHYDFAKHVIGDTHMSSPLYSDPAFKTALSSYGKSNPIEAYAEAFADWHYTRGRTKNPAAVSLAKYEGWFGSEGITASGVQKADDIISMVANNLVHFNILSFQGEPEDNEDDVYDDIPSFEDGVTVTDNLEEDDNFTGTEVEPSAEEIAAATELIKAVFEELGLDYDEYAKGEE